MGVYEELGLRTVINASGTLTRLGGSRMAPEVLAAMADAAASFVPIDDLQARAGEIIGEITGAEAGYVVTGAAAGLSLGVAACVAGMDVAVMDRLPDTSGLKNEVVVQRGHRNSYDHAIRAAGARLVEVGYLGFPGQGITWPWQVEAAITARTAALAYSAGRVPGAVPLEEVVAIAHRHGLPVIVDAAGALPPPENLRRFAAAGADLVAYSGGKAIGGPQASGLLVGRADLIESVALQHQDMDVYPATWTWRERYLASGRLPGPPHHGLGRPMKVGKEEIVGLVVALRRYLALDHEAERRAQEAQLETIVAALEGLPGVRAHQLADDLAPRAYPTVAVRIDEAVVGRDAAALINELIEGDPPVAVSQNLLHEGALALVASTLRPGDAEVVAARLRDVLTA